MKPLHIGAIVILALILIGGGLFVYLSPNSQPKSANEPDVIARVQQAEGTLSNLKFDNVAMVGERVLVQARYRDENDPTQPQEPAQWQALAEDTANKLYHDVVRNRGVEVQIYQKDALRGVAVAGL